MVAASFLRDINFHKSFYAYKIRNRLRKNYNFVCKIPNFKGISIQLRLVAALK